jgi:hypothetical protein
MGGGRQGSSRRGLVTPPTPQLSTPYRCPGTTVSDVTKRSALKLIAGDKPPATIRLASAFAEMRRIGEQSAQWDELLYGPGGGPPPPPERA